MLMGTILQFVVFLYVNTVADGAPIDPTCPGKIPQFFDGTTCKFCPSCKLGYGLSEVCGNGKGANAVCQQCPTGYFSDSDSVALCQPCTSCPTNMMEAAPCDSTSNRKCVPCKCGFVEGQCRSCEGVNKPDDEPEDVVKPDDKPIDENGSEFPHGPGAIALYVATPLVLLIVWAVLYFKKEIWGFVKRTALSSNHRDERNQHSNPDNPEEQQFVVGDQNGVEIRTHAEANIIHREEVQMLNAVPCSVLESQCDDFNPGSPTSSTGTQTSPFRNSDVSGHENRSWEFEEKLQKAIEKTKDTSLGDMKQADLNILERYLQAKGVVAKHHSTSEPNYNTIANMYEIDMYTQRGFESVTDVINHIANTDRTHPTVADFLKKVYDSGQCITSLVKLVEQIYDRTIEHGQETQTQASQSGELWV
ncbi:uncharacterized protein [Asterias amurensis]|uniref:uncharacterized protein n=1 Tax=Asterias amurensis TaxID=7602 RepID=UPI003AB4BF67